VLGDEELEDLCVVGCVYVGRLVFCVGGVYASVMCLSLCCCLVL